MRLALLFVLVSLAASGLAFPGPQEKHKGPPCDNFADNPHPCHCYDREDGKCPDSKPDRPCNNETENCSYDPAKHMGPNNNGHDDKGNADMGKKCTKYCDEKACQCEDSCKS